MNQNIFLINLAVIDRHLYGTSGAHKKVTLKYIKVQGMSHQLFIHLFCNLRPCPSNLPFYIIGRFDYTHEAKKIAK